MDGTIFGQGKEFWEVWGTFGDTIGGIANAVTMLVAFSGFWWARREVHRARAQHAEELRAAAARDIYRGVHAMVTTMKRLRKVSGPNAKAQHVDPLRAELDGDFPGYRAAVADARLIFGPALVPLLLRMAELAGDTIRLTHWQDHVESTALDKRIEEFSEEVVDALSYFATLSMGPPAPRVRK